MRRGGEVHAVDDALERRVRLGDVVQIRRQAFADLAGEPADDGPDRVIGILRFERQAEGDELVILLDEFECLGARADLGGDAVQLVVVEDVAEPLGEDERQDEVLELRGFLRSADPAGGVPDPGFPGTCRSCCSWFL